MEGDILLFFNGSEQRLRNKVASAPIKKEVAAATTDSTSMTFEAADLVQGRIF